MLRRLGNAVTRDMIKANAQGYFPYTPAATLLRGLRAAVDMLLEQGPEWYSEHRDDGLCTGGLRCQ